jgi:hypothetical protein
MIPCGSYNSGASLKYWELVRNDSPAQDKYARNRFGFSIDPGYGTESKRSKYFGDSYGINYAQSDVDIEVKGNITIPSGHHWYVTTDPDLITSPYVEETLIGFESGTGLTIENGGTLTSTGSTLWGVVDWFCFAGNNKGDWNGIAGEPGATIIMNYATISDAVVGLKLDADRTYDTEVILVDNSRDYGMDIIDCSPYMRAIEASASGSRAARCHQPTSESPEIQCGVHR